MRQLKAEIAKAMNGRAAPRRRIPGCSNGTR
jgi:hypothetical protein